ncbi:DUF1758 domain-containing protein [Trichonephila clavipes]|nr:DUF1758 domain-containing protein [Trichonephila clavipes]
MPSFVEAYSQGHISFKDEIGVRAVLWSDSTIAFTWINTPPNLLKTFVGNRVSKINQLSKDFQWKPISSECNPADMSFLVDWM